MTSVKPRRYVQLLSILLLAACSDGSDSNRGTNPPQLTTLSAGAASRSILPTVSGGRDYLADAPGWPAASDLDPNWPGVFIPVFDQGRVDVGNGESDAAWVHDDIRATALALERGEERVIFVTSNTYMHLKADVDEIVRRAQAALPDDWAGTDVLVSSSHNHHGPETAFGPNIEWYEMAAEQIADAVVEAVANLEPVIARVATGEHNYGTVDQRDPRIYDSRLNVIALDSAEAGESVALMVQWNSHPEATLGWEPPADAANLAEVCAIKGWEGDDCTAEDRYFSGDFVGVLETRLRETHGGEVAFFNGALGVLTGPLHAPVWVVDDEHPVGDGKTIPEGASPIADCDRDEPFKCQSFARTEAIGTELANAVNALLDDAAPMEFESLRVRKEEFFSRVTNVGFRVLAGEGELGWKPMEVFECGPKPFTEETCEPTGLETVEDPVITPLLGYKVARGDVLRTRVLHVDFGDVGMLFMPGEVPSELVIGLPEDFDSAPPEKYNEKPEEHATGTDYKIPGYYLQLMEDPITFTVGLGTDEVGYFVPPSDYRLQCHSLSLLEIPGASCADLAERGVIESPDWVGGEICQRVTDDPDYFESLAADGPAVKAICYYGQMVGAEIERPPGHYEETNSAGWDLVDDLWAATVRLMDSP